MHQIGLAPKPEALTVLKTEPWLGCPGRAVHRGQDRRVTRDWLERQDEYAGPLVSGGSIAEGGGWDKQPFFFSSRKQEGEQITRVPGQMMSSSSGEWCAKTLLLYITS